MRRAREKLTNRQLGCVDVCGTILTEFVRDVVEWFRSRYERMAGGGHNNNSTGNK
ncbi:tor pathway phosphatidylinositol 3-kinase [Anopheles sinensis]|uniref:Tor pathway phosphatidylinositol 3-kinase n=1 Tax=Anopheles sinensis TaxID=74873 RepID=A0A084WTX2_ANOSI|nr:tor pathway phosphatidylinositol 3-kinase [Anopheles sinensis]